eukprot:TRINITY_DN8440_c0_g1_i1.p1 TRINITY_DN8440_c0_g1~~TRINITY_DN8440_c0_g1_i1.p1  ORF type:complete len:521 (+),score=164.20 TRINITY_DN8440_c0_g1_i1:52-1614(+)
MKRVLVAACALVGAASADDCWKEHKQKELVCPVPGEPTRTGTIEEMKQECIELGDDCLGVVCSIQQDAAPTCEVRHHKPCEGGKFLQPSVSITTYVKMCEYNKMQWETHQDMYMKCFAEDESASGELLERQIRCAEMGPDRCLGVTCDYKQGSTAGEIVPENCTVRNFNSCPDLPVHYRTVLHSVPEGKKEVSYVMTLAPGQAPPAPAGPDPDSTDDGCKFTTYDNKNYGCNSEPGELMSLQAAKQKCLGMRSKDDASKDNICNGVVCRDLEGNECWVHMHCEAHRQKIHIDAPGMVLHETQCNVIDACRSACWSQKEFGGHQCRNDCDCDSQRVCSAMKYCKTKEEHKGTGAQVCRVGSQCVFDLHMNQAMVCESDAGDLSLEEAKERCIAMEEECGGVTCSHKTGKCTVRNHHHETCPVTGYLELDSNHDTYVKCCGTDQQQHLHCPGAFTAKSSGGVSGWVIFLVLALLGVVGFLAYQNRVMAKSYIAPNDFNVLDQDGDDEDDFVVGGDDADDIDH